MGQGVSRCVLLASTWGSHIPIHPDSRGGEGLAGSERREEDQQGLVVMVLRGPQPSQWVGKSWGGWRGWRGQEEML